MRIKSTFYILCSLSLPPSLSLSLPYLFFFPPLSQIQTCKFSRERKLIFKKWLSKSLQWKEANIKGKRPLSLSSSRGVLSRSRYALGPWIWLEKPQISAATRLPHRFPDKIQRHSFQEGTQKKLQSKRHTKEKETFRIVKYLCWFSVSVSGDSCVWIFKWFFEC